MTVGNRGVVVLGRPFQVTVIAHQNTPDLAVQTYGKERHVTTLDASGDASRFSGPGCSPFGWDWVPSTNAVAKAVARGGGRTSFFITADDVFDNGLSAASGKAATAAGGAVMDEVKHALGTADMSSPLFQAQAPGADLAHAME